MTFIMMLVGLGMVLGNLLSGKLSGRYTPLRIAVVTDLVIVLSLMALFLQRIQNGIADFRVYLLRWSVCALCAAANPATAKRQRRRTAGRGGRANRV